jgi:glucokinase
VIGSSLPFSVVAGVDVGGTKVALVMADLEGNVLAQQAVPTDRDRLVSQLIELVRTASARLPSAARLAAVGIAAPGQVDTSAGTVRMAVNLGQEQLVLGAPITAGLGVPCVLEHDARAAAAWLFEERRRAGEPARGLAYLAIGTGISAGVVIGGTPLAGAHGLAGEVGHLVADPSGPICGCGLVGCLEAVAAGPAIARRARELLAAGGLASALPPDATAEQVFDCARAGDPLAIRVVQETAGHLARAVRGLALAFGVDAVVIGGGVAGAGEDLELPLREALDAERARSPLADTALGRTSVRLLPSAEPAGALGAAMIARARLGGPTPASGGKGVGRDQ